MLLKFWLSHRCAASSLICAASSRRCAANTRTFLSNKQQLVLKAHLLQNNPSRYHPPDMLRVTIPCQQSLERCWTPWSRSNRMTSHSWCQLRSVYMCALCQPLPAPPSLPAGCRISHPLTSADRHASAWMMTWSNLQVGLWHQSRQPHLRISSSNLRNPALLLIVQDGVGFLISAATIAMQFMLLTLAQSTCLGPKDIEKLFGTSISPLMPFSSCQYAMSGQRPDYAACTCLAIVALTASQPAQACKPTQSWQALYHEVWKSHCQSTGRACAKVLDNLRARCSTSKLQKIRLLIASMILWM